MQESLSPPRSGVPMNMPHVGYVLLWFPLASETFVFREVQFLADAGMPIDVFAMYGEKLRGCSREMRETTLPVRHYGMRRTLSALGAFFRALRQRPRLTVRLFRECLCSRMRSWETRGENLLCFLFGFLLAEEAVQKGIQLLHAAWGNGPATAAWTASRLTGIPFAFTGRAGDIYPPDGILEKKARDALFLRANNAATVSYLAGFCPPDDREKVRLVYNSLTLKDRRPATVPFQPPFRLLSIGRFVPKKGFDVLLTAIARLRREGLPLTLTLVGDGRLRRSLQRQCKNLRLEDCVQMPGFIPNDRVQELMHSSDLFVMPCVESETGDRDGIPNVIMEALSCRLPVVATDVNGIREVIVNEETGLLVPQRSPRELAEAIRQMLQGRDEALRMAEAGRDRVLSMFDSTRNTSQLAELYTSFYQEFCSRS